MALQPQQPGFDMAYNPNDEQVARLTGLFKALQPHQQRHFLQENRLKPEVAENQSNSLQISPARKNQTASLRMQNRTKKALRLAEDDLGMIAKTPGKPLMNVSGVRFTDSDMKEWFDQLDKDDNGTLSKAEFRELYGQLEQFGTPVRQSWMEAELVKINAEQDGRITFDEFAYLVSHVAQR